MGILVHQIKSCDKCLLRYEGEACPGCEIITLRAKLNKAREGLEYMEKYASDEEVRLECNRILAKIDNPRTSATKETP